MAVMLWFFGLLGLLVATLVASARARAMPADVVGRRVIATAAIAYVGIAVAAVWTWGGATATAGRSLQLREGALVHLTVDGVRVPLTAAIAIGHARDAAFRLPGDGGEVARIEPAGAGGAVVRGALLAVVHGEDGAVAATMRGCAASEASYSIPPGAAVAVAECSGGKPARAFVVRNRRGEIAVAPLSWRGRFVAGIGGGEDAIAGLTTWDVIAPHGAAAMLAIPADPTDCAAWLPDAVGPASPTQPAADTSRATGKAAGATGRDQASATPPEGDASRATGKAAGATGRDQALPTPPEENAARAAGNAAGAGQASATQPAGDASRAAGIPGQRDPASPIDPGDAARAAGKAVGIASPRDQAWRIDGGCAVEAGAFTVAAVPLVPDADRVIDRGLCAAFAIGGPPLALLVVLALAARRDRRVRSVARALRLCMLGASLTALCCWRLLWAYRIDMMRELATVGSRLVENQLAVVAIGAALAGNAVLAHESIAAASAGRRAFAAALAWTAWFAIAALITRARPVARRRGRAGRVQRGVAAGGTARARARPGGDRGRGGRGQARRAALGAGQDRPGVRARARRARGAAPAAVG
ncbi:MAG: hypothetical protein E6J91_50600 [Deltaproteobacteria bacterium]|nr:MAG: hypothetical protein E6J91_50600 [Deltaproteobacteria bacterium]